MTKHLFRRINKQRSSFALGQFTLILGMLSCLIIYGFVMLHHSFDSFHIHSERISRINTVEADGRTIALTEGLLRDRITANFTETPVTHFMKTPVDLSFEHDDKVITSTNGLLVDPYFLEVFQFPNLQSPDLLQDPNGVILSRTLANKLFGEQHGVNETLKLQMGPRKINLTVRAVMDDLPNNSSLTFDYLITGPGMMFWNDEAPWAVFQTFMLAESTTQTSILDFVNDTKIPEGQSIYGVQPLKEVHLGAGIEFDSLEKFDPKYLQLLSVTGILTFLVTLFNFFNLFYNQITTRIREITTRKVLGSSFSSITKSLLVEIYFHLTCALILTYCFLFILNEPLMEFLGYKPALVHHPRTLLVIILGTGVFATLLVWVASQQMNNYNVQNGLRGKIKISKLGFNLGKLLLTGQFIVTLLAITSGLFITQQTQLLRSAEVGYDYHDVVTIKRPDQVPYATWKTFQETLNQQAAVLSTGLAVFPSIGEYNMMRLQDLTQQEHRLYWIGVDPGFLPSMEINLISGRNFDPRLPSDNQTLIVNQKALALLGGERALSHEFKFRKKSFNIIGVVRDFHHQSLKEAVEPMMMTLNNPQAFRHMVVRYEGFTQSDMSNLILASATDLGMPTDLSHTFMEKEYNQKLMKEESILAQVVSTFSGIAILISLLGLFSFLAFEVNQKKGDLSIMKVLGAKFRDHLKNLGWGPFLTMVIAAVITLPVGLYYLSQWKTQFMFQIELGVIHVLTPLVVLSVLVLLVATFFSMQIEQSNPVVYLKDE